MGRGHKVWPSGHSQSQKVNGNVRYAECTLLSHIQRFVRHYQSRCKRHNEWQANLNGCWEEKDFSLFFAFLSFKFKFVILKFLDETNVMT